MITKCQKSGKWQKIFKSEKSLPLSKKSSPQKNLQKWREIFKSVTEALKNLQKWQNPLRKIFKSAYTIFKSVKKCPHNLQKWRRVFHLTFSVILAEVFWRTWLVHIIGFCTCFKFEYSSQSSHLLIFEDLNFLGSAYFLTNLQKSASLI